MPSIFEVMKRIVLGKPVFTDDGSQPAKTTEVPSHAGPKVIPVVAIERYEFRHNGPQMQFEVVIQNNSGVVIELDKIKLLGTSRELDSFLKPGEEREYQVYSGLRPQNTYNDKCELYYKDPTGDYFCAIYQVEFERQPDNTYVIDNLKFTPPIRDV